MQPLHVALVWHMHQPYYRDDLSGRFMLPWARLRASKDYGRMTRLATRHPDLRITINYVPSLFEQLAAYAQGDDHDPHRELCLRRAEELTADDRRFLVTLTRGTGFPYKVRLFAPLLALLERLRQGDADDVADQLPLGDLRDLQTFAKHVGVRPQGMWPSECAVSPDAAALMSAAGMRWAISDEHVLERSLQHRVRGDARASTLLYSPWRDPSGLTMVFRDAELSN